MLPTWDVLIGLPNSRTRSPKRERRDSRRVDNCDADVPLIGPVVCGRSSPRARWRLDNLRGCLAAEAAGEPWRDLDDLRLADAITGRWSSRPVESCFRSTSISYSFSLPCVSADTCDRRRPALLWLRCLRRGRRRRRQRWPLGSELPL